MHGLSCATRSAGCVPNSDAIFCTAAPTIFNSVPFFPECTKPMALCSRIDQKDGTTIGHVYPE